MIPRLHAAVFLVSSLLAVGFGDDVSADLCRQPNGLFSNPDDCTTFIRCQGGKPDLEECPEGLLFNPSISTCDYSLTGNCTDSDDFDSTSISVRTNDIVCSQDDPNIMPIESSCSEYYLCENGEAFKVRCPSNLLMNKDRAICDYEENVQCDASFSEKSTAGITAIFEENLEESETETSDNANDYSSDIFSDTEKDTTSSITQERNLQTQNNEDENPSMKSTSSAIPKTLFAATEDSTVVIVSDKSEVDKNEHTSEKTSTNVITNEKLSTDSDSTDAYVGNLTTRRFSTADSTSSDVAATDLTSILYTSTGKTPDNPSTNEDFTEKTDQNQPKFSSSITTNEWNVERDENTTVKFVTEDSKVSTEESNQILISQNPTDNVFESSEPPVSQTKSVQSITNQTVDVFDNHTEISPYSDDESTSETKDESTFTTIDKLESSTLGTESEMTETDSDFTESLNYNSKTGTFDVSTATESYIYKETNATQSNKEIFTTGIQTNSKLTPEETKSTTQALSDHSTNVSTNFTTSDFITDGTDDVSKQSSTEEKSFNYTEVTNDTTITEENTDLETDYEFNSSKTSEDNEYEGKISTTPAYFSSEFDSLKVSTESISLNDKTIENTHHTDFDASTDDNEYNESTSVSTLDYGNSDTSETETKDTLTTAQFLESSPAQKDITSGFQVTDNTAESSELSKSTTDFTLIDGNESTNTSSTIAHSSYVSSTESTDVFNDNATESLNSSKQTEITHISVSPTLAEVSRKTSTSLPPEFTELTNLESTDGYSTLKVTFPEVTKIETSDSSTVPSSTLKLSTSTTHQSDISSIEYEKTVNNLSDISETYSSTQTTKSEIDLGYTTVKVQTDIDNSTTELNKQTDIPDFSPVSSTLSGISKKISESSVPEGIEKSTLHHRIVTRNKDPELFSTTDSILESKVTNSMFSASTEFWTSFENTDVSKDTAMTAVTPYTKSKNTTETIKPSNSTTTRTSISEVTDAPSLTSFEITDAPLTISKTAVLSSTPSEIAEGTPTSSEDRDAHSLASSEVTDQPSSTSSEVTDAPVYTFSDVTDAPSTTLFTSSKVTDAQSSTYSEVTDVASKSLEVIDSSTSSEYTGAFSFPSSDITDLSSSTPSEVTNAVSSTPLEITFAPSSTSSEVTGAPSFTSSEVTDEQSSTFSGVTGAPSSTFSEVTGAPSSTFSEVTGAPSSTFSEVTGAPSSTFSEVTGAPSSTFSEVTGAPSSTFSEVTGAPSSTFSEVTDTPSSTFSEVTDTPITPFFTSSEVTDFPSSTFSEITDTPSTPLITSSKVTAAQSSTFSEDTPSTPLITSSEVTAARSSTFSGDTDAPSFTSSEVTDAPSSTFSEVTDMSSTPLFTSSEVTDVPSSTSSEVTHTPPSTSSEITDAQSSTSSEVTHAQKGSSRVTEAQSSTFSEITDTPSTPLITSSEVTAAQSSTFSEDTPSTPLITSSEVTPARSSTFSGDTDAPSFTSSEVTDAPSSTFSEVTDMSSTPLFTSSEVTDVPSSTSSEVTDTPPSTSSEITDAQSSTSSEVTHAQKGSSRVTEAQSSTPSKVMDASTSMSTEFKDVEISSDSTAKQASIFELLSTTQTIDASKTTFLESITTDHTLSNINKTDSTVSFTSTVGITGDFRTDLITDYDSNTSSGITTNDKKKASTPDKDYTASIPNDIHTKPSELHNVTAFSTETEDVLETTTIQNEISSVKTFSEATVGELLTSPKFVSRNDISSMSTLVDVTSGIKETDEPKSEYLSTNSVPELSTENEKTSYTTQSYISDATHQTISRPSRREDSTDPTILMSSRTQNTRETISTTNEIPVTNLITETETEDVFITTVPDISISTISSEIASVENNSSESTTMEMSSLPTTLTTNIFLSDLTTDAIETTHSISEIIRPINTQPPRTKDSSDTTIFISTLSKSTMNLISTSDTTQVTNSVTETGETFENVSATELETTGYPIESTTWSSICRKPSGFYPNPHNCSTFYKCDRGIPELASCTENNHFNPIKLMCEDPCMAKCDKNAACPTTEVEVSSEGHTLTTDTADIVSSTKSGNTDSLFTTSEIQTGKTWIPDDLITISNITSNETSISPPLYFSTDSEVISDFTTEATFPTEDKNTNEMTDLSTLTDETTETSSSVTNEQTQSVSDDNGNSKFTEIYSSTYSSNYVTNSRVPTTMTAGHYTISEETEPPSLYTSAGTKSDIEYQTTGTESDTPSTDDFDIAYFSTIDWSSSVPDTTKCENEECISTEVSVAPSPLPFKLCHRNDFLSRPNCNEYTDCTKRFPEKKQCPTGLHFNPTKRVCDWPFNADCGEIVKPLYKPDDSFSCPCKSCLIPSTKSCSHYYLCLGFTAYHLKCSENLLFDTNLNTCNYAPIVSCLLPTTTSTSVSDKKPTDSYTTITSSRATTKVPTTVNQPSSSTSKPEKFVCPTREGLFKYPGNCEKFYQCSNWYPYLMQCAAATHFSEETKRCEYPCDAKCDSSLRCGKSTTASPKDPRCSCLNCKLPSPETCTKYIVCVNGKARIDRCPWGQTFDIRKSSCDWAHKVMCNHTEICPERNGLFPFKNNCHKFVHCSNGIPYIKSCPSVLEFDQDKKRCEWPAGRCSQASPIAKEAGTVKEEKQRDGFRCPKTYGYFSDDHNCNKFYHCSYATPSLKECSLGLVYNPKYQTCDWKKHVRCSSNRHQKPKRCRTFDHHVKCMGDRKPLPHTLCNMYYDCTAGRACAKQCPVGLYYNRTTEICDLPQNVKCYDPNKEDYSLQEFAEGCLTNDHGRMPNPSDAACFYHCRQGKVISGCCHKGHIYNAHRDRCERKPKSLKI